MMLRVSPFFLSFLFAVAGMAAQPPVAPGQDFAPGQDSTELYRQAVARFQGPSTIHRIESLDASLKQWNPPDVAVENAVVLDWNDKDLIVVRRDSLDKVVLPSPNVVRIEPKWENELAASLHADFLAGRFADAIAKGGRLLGQKSEQPGTPRWQQRVLIAELVECSVALNRWERACLLYAALAKDQPPPLLLTAMPIPWSATTAEIKDRVKVQELAVGWLEDSRPPLQLMGAAWLLDSDRREEAARTLERLSQLTDKGVLSNYAAAQLWKTSTPKDLSSERIAQWTGLRDSMPLPFQAGPTYLMAEKLSRAGNSPRALEEFLRVGMLHPDKPYLAKPALAQAQQLVQSSSQSQDAERIQDLSRKLGP
jgi:hypothetical protein